MIDQNALKKIVDDQVATAVDARVTEFFNSNTWIDRIEYVLNQTVTHKTLAALRLTNINAVVHQRVDENMARIRTDFVKNFASSGIMDQATQNQIDITDQSTLVKNHLLATNLEVSDSIMVNNLAVRGSINVDNTAWDGLATHISQRTLDALTDSWRDQLVSDVADKISRSGIKFDQIFMGDHKLVDGNQLSSNITESALQSVGSLKTLIVSGAAHINNGTVNVLNQRVGINTDAPEKALSIWDEEVSVVIGKHKLNQAYLGTNRDQALAIGVNREPQIEINTTGLTTIKQLQVGLHRISHATQVPGWSGTRGDLVFNASPDASRVFAWVCLGAHRWQTLKSAE